MHFNHMYHFLIVGVWVNYKSKRHVYLEIEKKFKFKMGNTGKNRKHLYTLS